jgi:thiamine monophosphate kinase
MVIYYGVEDFQILLLFEVKNLAKKIKNSITSIGRPTCVGQMSTTAMVFTFLPTTTAH